MPKQDAHGDCPQQLKLDFDCSAAIANVSSNSADSNVTPFVDAATRRVRELALDRVRAAGIFAPPIASKGAQRR